MYISGDRKWYVSTFYIQDAPQIFQYDDHASYRPANYGGGFSMQAVTMRTALIKSLNVVTVDVAMRTGLNVLRKLQSLLACHDPRLIHRSHSAQRELAAEHRRGIIPPSPIAAKGRAKINHSRSGRQCETYCHNSPINKKL